MSNLSAVCAADCPAYLVNARTPRWFTMSDSIPDLGPDGPNRIVEPPASCLLWVLHRREVTCLTC
jgi:hypothetical protein